jgi:hypothetical protein
MIFVNKDVPGNSVSAGNARQELRCIATICLMTSSDAMDWSRLPRKFLTSWVDAPRCRGRAHSYGHDLTRELQLIGFNTGRAAVQRGV